MFGPEVDHLLRFPYRVSGGYAELYMPQHPLARKTGYVTRSRAIMHALGYDVQGKIVHHGSLGTLDDRPFNLTIMDSRLPCAASSCWQSRV